VGSPDRKARIRVGLSSNPSNRPRPIAHQARPRSGPPLRALADRTRAEESLKLTEDEVERGIDGAHAELKAVHADLVLALADHARISNQESRGSATRQDLDQMVRTGDSSRAQVELAEARLAKALSARTQLDVARRALEGLETRPNASATPGGPARDGDPAGTGWAVAP
jgi:hypothetical protein